LLKTQSQRNKLLLIITDGEPADVDETDAEYLHWDARKAVEELETAGISSYCLTLDFKAGNYVTRIFGNNRYTILDNVERLPERLPELFLSLTKH
jgi:nitric oxide reductase activation protein